MRQSKITETQRMIEASHDAVVASKLLIKRATERRAPDQLPKLQRGTQGAFPTFWIEDNQRTECDVSMPVLRGSKTDRAKD